MKKNNKGFLLVESLVVSTFVLTVIMLLYIQFSNLTINYKNSYSYNNIESLYDLSSVIKYLNKNEYNLSPFLTKTTPYVILFENNNCNTNVGFTDSFCKNLINKTGAKTIIYTDSNIDNIQKYLSGNEDKKINQKFREFILKVNTPIIQNKGRLFAEFNNETYATIAMDNESYIQTLPDSDSNTSILNCTSNNIDSTKDGLYKDEYENGKCIFKGKAPNNYILFNNEMWRIISIEPDNTLKLIKNESVDKKVWDDSNSTNWTNSYIKNYLNNEYLSKLQPSISNQIINFDFNIGAVTWDNNNISNQIKKEKTKTWNGKVGLLSVSEYIRANSNDNCSSLNLNNKNFNSCKETNWIYNIVLNENNIWTISSSKGNKKGIYIVNGTNNYIDVNSSNLEYTIFPVISIKNTSNITGNGTSDNPYKIRG